jgi:nitric oxide reductase activation protein
MYKDERKFFVNLSDGEPGHSFTYKGNHYSYGGEGAYKHTRQLMNDFRTAGIKVMSYFIGASNYEHAAFKKMYGQDARFIDPKSVGQIVATVNKLLMNGDK